MEGYWNRYWRRKVRGVRSWEGPRRGPQASAHSQSQAAAMMTTMTTT